jgi:hypothetical protein
MRTTSAALFFLLTIGLGAAVPNFAYPQNLLRNADFSQGSNLKPDSWDAETWLPGPTTTFAWIAPQEGNPGILEIGCGLKDDARWTQSLKIGPGPGIYFVGAEVRTENVDEKAGGAFVTLNYEAMEAAVSGDVSGTSDWRRIGFLVRIPEKTYAVEVKLRLGGMMNFTTGRAFFRNPRVFLVHSAIPPGTMIFDLTMVRDRWRGRPWTVPIAFLVLMAGTVVGWRMLEG